MNPRFCKGEEAAEGGKMLTQIEAERIRHHLTREELIKQIGVSMKTYSDWVNERHDIPGKKLIRLSQIFGCPADILLQSSNGERMPLSSYTRIVVETDEENPVQIATVESDSVHAAEGYRVRLTPKYN